MEDRIKVDKIPRPVPFPELAALLEERLAMREKVENGTADTMPAHRAADAADAVARARADAARRGEPLADDAPAHLTLAAAREQQEAATLLLAAHRLALESVDEDVCDLLDRNRSTYLDLLGKSRRGAEARVGAALTEASEALAELGRAQAIYAFLDDWPGVDWASGAYLPGGAELGLLNAQGDPLTVGAVIGALRDAAGRPRRARKDRAVETVTRALRGPRRARETAGADPGPPAAPPF